MAQSMAATLMQPPVHRPSMDHVSSFDRSRPSSTVAPFASSTYDRAPSPAAAAGTPRSRTSSSTSASPAPSPLTTAAPTPFHQPYSVPNFYPPFPMHHQQAWGNPPPATSFYTAGAFQAHGSFPNGVPPFQPGTFQGGPADFSAWAHVYQQMVAGGHMPAPGHMPMPQGHQDVDDVSPQEVPRRRTSSAPRPSHTLSPKATVAPTTIHPYQRGPKHRSSSSRDRTAPRSGTSSTTGTPSLDGHSMLPPQPRGASPADGHRRVASATNSSQPGGDFAPPPKFRDAHQQRPSSVHSRSSSRSHDSNNPTRSSATGVTSARASPPASGSASPVGPSSAAASVRSGSHRPAPSPPVADSTPAASASRPSPSPLSQTKPLVQPSEQLSAEKRSGMMNRIRHKEQKHISKASISTPTPIRTEAVGGNSKLGTPTAPNAPFMNVQAMGSDVSLAETERTAATTASAAGMKTKRGLFRNRNKSSDNISLSSTVSSASMMIRKMGSIGKLARRNSLMGISKIFKDKPKDEDSPIPEKQGVFSGFKKKSNKKAEAAPAAISRSVVEIDRMGDDDHVITGLSPAAQLARQHTARSKAEASKRAEEAKKRAAAAKTAAAAQPITEMGGASGEPTWDSNTTTRTNPSTAARPDSVMTNGSGTSIVHVVPRGGPTVVQAVQYNAGGAEVESISSVDDTVEDLTSSMNQANLNDDDFQPLWTQAHVDYNARPKKGILKNTVSNEDMENQALRHRSASTSEAIAPSIHGPLSAMPAPLPEKIDGVVHASHSNTTETLDPTKTYDPLSPNFAPFDSSSFELDLKPTIYNNSAHNTSAPSLSVAGKPVPTRSMTAPIRRRLIWAPECAVYNTYDAVTYDRRSEPATCNRLTPELAMAIKQELNTFKLEMSVHPSSRHHTHYFA